MKPSTRHTSSSPNLPHSTGHKSGGSGARRSDRDLFRIPPSLPPFVPPFVRAQYSALPSGLLGCVNIFCLPVRQADDGTLEGILIEFFFARPASLVSDTTLAGPPEGAPLPYHFLPCLHYQTGHDRGVWSSLSQRSVSRGSHCLPRNGCVR